MVKTWQFPYIQGIKGIEYLITPLIHPINSDLRKVIVKYISALYFSCLTSSMDPFLGAPHIDQGLLFIQVVQTDGLWVHQTAVVLNLSYNLIVQGLNPRYATPSHMCGHPFPPVWAIFPCVHVPFLLQWTVFLCDMRALT